MRTHHQTFFYNTYGSQFPLRSNYVSLLPLAMLLAQIPVLFFSLQTGMFPEIQDWKSIVGTFAEIIAGLYGITAAGYTFFLSRIDALLASDDTLEPVVDSIKRRFKYLIWYITANVLMTLLTSIVLLYCPVPEGESMGFFYRLFCNEFLVFLIFSMALILLYSIMVVDPNAISKEAGKLKKRMSHSDVPGDTVEFFRMYGRIRELCQGMLPRMVVEQFRTGKGFLLTLQLLECQHLLPRLLIYDIYRLYRYYGCVVNASDIGVSQDMCALAKRVLSFLENVAQQKEEALLLRGE